MSSTLNSYPPFGVSFLFINYQLAFKDEILIHIRIGV